MNNSKSFQLCSLLNQLNFNKNGKKYSYFINDYSSKKLNVYWNNESNVFNRYTSIAIGFCIQDLDGKHIDFYIEYFTTQLANLNKNNY